MKQIEIQGETGRSTIAVGESLRNLEKYVHGTKSIIITDENVKRLYENDFPQWDTITIGTNMSLYYLFNEFRWMLQRKRMNHKYTVALFCFLLLSFRFMKIELL